MIADAKGETIVNVSIDHVKAHGSTTTSGRDCTVRTAGLDPDPIGDSGIFLVVGTVTPKLLSTNTHQMSKGAYLEELYLNHKDTCNETPCVTFSAYPEHASKWNQSNQSSDKGDILVTSQVIRNSSDLDIPALIGGFRSNQEELSYKPNCSGILRHQRTTSNWIHTRIHYGLEVIQVLNQEIPGLPYLEAHGFNHLQTRLWRPGETPNHSGDILDQLETLQHVSSPSKTHRIHWRCTWTDFPYIDPSAFNMFTLGVLTLQRLYPCCYHDLRPFSMNLDIPRSHGFSPKLSRLKHTSSFLILADLLI